MKRIFRHRPSPAMLVAICALGVALGGVAFATIPDSSGTIHGCYQKNSGDLRVVDPSAACRPSETAISWNQDGGSGVRVVTRIRSQGPINVSAGETKQIPLSGNTWRQEAGEFQEVLGQVEQEGSTCFGRGEIEITNPFLNLPSKLPFDVIANADPTVLFAGTRELGAPDESVEHSLTVSVRTSPTCEQGSVTIRSVKMTVVGYR